MKVIDRERPLKRLIGMMHNGRIKIITGIRRSGKSFLLFRLFKEHLHQQGIDDGQIIEIALDQKQYEAMRNPNTLYQYVVEKLKVETNSSICSLMKFSSLIRSSA